jgi:hypothetical protein
MHRSKNLHAAIVAIALLLGSVVSVVAYAHDRDRHNESATITRYGVDA